MTKDKVLFILTGHDRLGNENDTSADETGFHLAEAARPWRAMTDAGYEVDLVTPKGGRAPIDPGSHDMEDPDNQRFLGDARVQKQIEATRPLADVDIDDYVAVYFPGGHGTMWDLPDDEKVQQTVRTMYESGKIVGAVCHGPAALVNVRLSNGEWLVRGRTLSVFTDSEERAVDKESVVPFLLASELEERGARIAEADDFEKSVSVDERLVTGQNPASALGVADSMLRLLREQRAKAA